MTVGIGHLFLAFFDHGSGPESPARQAIHAFVSGSKDKFSLYDFSSACWKDFDEVGNQTEDGAEPRELPSIGLDLWFKVAENDLYLVIPLLPSTAWLGTEVGIRIEDRNLAASQARQASRHRYGHLQMAPPDREFLRQTERIQTHSNAKRQDRQQFRSDDLPRHRRQASRLNRDHSGSFGSK
jgi:hypothetical protein